METNRTKMLAMALTLLFANMGRAALEKRHVQLVTPTPFVWAEYGPTNPLRTDGSDYPCKIPHGDEFTINGTATDMAIGDEQTVSFSGWSVHGGGSCQFALTEGHAPTPDSAWKVIHSIEGGCPKANVAGNLQPGQNPDTYTFTIPDDFAPGNYTWAWTWVNKIAASAEFYMNCAPIRVTAAGGPSTTKQQQQQQRRKDRRSRRGGSEIHALRRRASDASYPDLFLANIGSASNGCTTSEAVAQQIAIAFPHPGSSVSWPNGREDLFAQACDGNPRNNGASSASAATGSAGGGAAAAATTSTATTTATTVSSLPVTTTAAALASTAPLSAVPVTPSVEAASSETASSVLATRTPSFSSSALNTVVSGSAAAASTTASSSTSVLDSPCTDGHLLCVDGTQFSTCTGSAWDAPQNLAAHTTCEGGEGVGLRIVNQF